MRNFLSSHFFLHFSSCLPTKYNPPEWASIPDRPGGMWRWAASAQHHSWLCTAVSGWVGSGWGEEAGGIIRDVCFIISGGMHVACHYPAFVQLRSDGFHQQRHGGGRPRDVGGARVNHSRAAFGAEHHLHSHWNSGEERHSGKPRMASGAHIWSLHCIFTPSWLLPICPSLWCPCS